MLRQTIKVDSHGNCTECFEPKIRSRLLLIPVVEPMSTSKHIALIIPGNQIRLKRLRQPVHEAEKPLEHFDYPIRYLDKNETKGTAGVILKRKISKNKNDTQNQDNKFSVLDSEISAVNSESD